MRELQLKKVVQDILSREFQKEILPEFWLVTITWVKIATDFSYADVYISNIPQNDSIINYLNTRAWFFQKILNKKIERKTVPMVRFHYDNSSDVLLKLDNL